ncbi:penicillin-insensitive murein endopeptidase [Acuticoccus sediminis]|uniref:Penicillin-insensitive murein endopeptidase n=1 Tax=Acuticoccus sediminis TaxID=2184697 RepID=A0A8B2P2U8_9HYPH|nr:penicillin-insensitive murein endopeptidase [Acuticoccus sediminis]RAI03462.1 penicillin-insensitive murein endopeptidase [Acuticoccus sediminis]
MRPHDAAAALVLLVTLAVAPAARSADASAATGTPRTGEGIVVADSRAKVKPVARTTARKADPDPSLAKVRFAAVTGPTAPPAEPLGRYGKGCIAGAVQLAAEGAHHSAMRLSRGRRWGHPATIAFVEDLAAAAAGGGLNGILVGDISQARGGPMLFGHSSHQVGLDVDIWYARRPETPLTDEERETRPFESVLNADGTTVDPAKFTPEIAALVREAASDRRVARVFVHPHIKKAMCAMSRPHRRFLRRIRPWYGHDEHFHVRLKCPRGARGCDPQPDPPKGDGCGADLDYWYTPAPWTPDPKARPGEPLTVERMPPACQRLLDEPDYAAAPVPTGQLTPVPPSPQ